MQATFCFISEKAGVMFGFIGPELLIAGSGLLYWRFVGAAVSTVALAR
jgi:hypothetical protein